MSEAPADSLPALFDACPQLAARAPWLPLGRYPTPVERVTVQDARGTRDILVKRDDLTGEPYGGNKVRKLEFILADARACGAQRLITAGAAGSHHALATAIYGRQLGFDVTLVLFPQRLTPHVRDILLMDHAYHAELRWVRRMEAVPIAVAAARMAYLRERPYTVKPGGSDPIGTLGYVSAGLELAGQIRASAGERPDAVYVAAGTLGTAAGLAVGFALAGLDVPIRAIRITSSLVANDRLLRRLVHQVVRLLRAGGVEGPDPAHALRLLDLRHDQIGEGYGKATPAGIAATEAFAAAGLRLDPTYTAKAAAALLADPPGGAPPLFLHTLSASEPLERARGVSPADLPEPFARYVGTE